MGAVLNPHVRQPLLRAGRDLHEASLVMVMIHGRGGTAGDILGFAEEFGRNDVCFLAPQAEGNSWYPYRFNEPVERNEPWLSSALDAVANIFIAITEAGLDHRAVILFGFSQGACLALEFAARNPKEYAGVIGLSGGLIGAPPGPYSGSLLQTPVFLGCSDVDPHIPKDRVLLSERILLQLDGKVDARLYSGMAHTINRDEISVIRTMIKNARS